jgi:chromosome segregation ATPase
MAHRALLSLALIAGLCGAGSFAFADEEHHIKEKKQAHNDAKKAKAAKNRLAKTRKARAKAELDKAVKAEMAALDAQVKQLNAKIAEVEKAAADEKAHFAAEKAKEAEKKAKEAKEAELQKKAADDENKMRAEAKKLQDELAAAKAKDLLDAMVLDQTIKGLIAEAQGMAHLADELEDLADDFDIWPLYVAVEHLDDKIFEMELIIEHLDDIWDELDGVIGNNRHEVFIWR